MPIKWSAVQVAEAMDGIEQQLNLAQSFIDEALERVKTARKIANLPGYMNDRLARVEYTIEAKWGYIREGIRSVRKAVPEKDLVNEREQAKWGKQQSLSL